MPREFDELRPSRGLSGGNSSDTFKDRLGPFDTQGFTNVDTGDPEVNKKYKLSGEKNFKQFASPDPYSGVTGYVTAPEMFRALSNMLPNRFAAENFLSGISRYPEQNPNIEDRRNDLTNIQKYKAFIEHMDRAGYSHYPEERAFLFRQGAFPGEQVPLPQRNPLRPPAQPQEERSLSEISSDPFGLLPRRALGGKVDPNQPYVVGEKGKEVFVPDRPGTIVANAELDTLPAGARLIEDPHPPDVLPPGAKPYTPPPPKAQVPSPLQGTTLSQDPAEQAREVAALRLGRQRPPEGKADVTGPTDLVPGSVKAGFNQFLRDAGGKLQEPQNALPMALSGPVAPGIAAMRGGAALVRGMSESGIAAGDATATGKMLQGRITGATGPLPQRLTTIADKPPEEAIAHMANMARTGSAEDLAALARMRQLTPVKSQPEVQAQLIQHLGKSDAGDFSATDFVRRYGELSDASKNILFGQGGTGSLKNHLDSIAEVSDRLWRGPSLKTMAKVAGGASAIGAFTGGGAVAAPVAVLSAMIPVKVLAHALTSAPTTAAIAAWSRAYEKVVTSGTNAALTSFNIATRNLNNNLGTDVDPSKVLNGGASGQPVE